MGTKDLLMGGVICLCIFTGYQYIIRQEPNRESNNHRNLTSLVQSSPRNISLDDARRESTKRQTFLNELVKGIEIPYCDGVFYDHSGELILNYFDEEIKKTTLGKKVEVLYIGEQRKAFENGQYDVKTPSVLDRSEEGRKSPIFVGRKFFEDHSINYLTKEDMKEIIVSHEGEHVIQHALGVPNLKKEFILNAIEKDELNPTVLYHLFEYDAYSKELPRLLSKEFQASWFHFNNIKAQFILTGFGLTKSTQNASQLQQLLIQNIHMQTYQNPVLRDITVDSEYYSTSKKNGWR